MADISFTLKFNLALTPKQFQLFDTSDWAGQGIALTDVNGNFKIVGPSGSTLHNNTDFDDADCDINIVSSLENQDVINLPVNGSGIVEAGDYVITYTVRNSDTDEDYVLTTTFTYDYTSPTLVIRQNVDCISPLFTSTDGTNYVVNGISPTLDRTHDIYYPNGSAGQGTPVEGTGTVVSTGVFYPRDQTTEITSGLTYVFADGLIVIDEISGNQSIAVDCASICAIYCCIKAAWAKLIGLQTSNYAKFLEYQPVFNTSVATLSAALFARSCGVASDISAYLGFIQDSLKCTAACSGCADDMGQIMGLAGLVNNIVVQSGDAYINVEPVTVGNTTTFTVTLSTSFINSLYNTIVSGGDNITVIITGTNPKTYTVKGLKAIVAAGNGITVTASAVVAGVQTYTVKANLEKVVHSSALALTLEFAGVESADDLALSETISVAGTYNIVYSGFAYFDPNGETDYGVNYGITKNGIFSSPTIPEYQEGVTTDPSSPARVSSVLFCNNQLTLIIGDVISVFYEKAVTGAGASDVVIIQNRLITLTKIA